MAVAYRNFVAIIACLERIERMGRGAPDFSPALGILLVTGSVRIMSCVRQRLPRYRSLTFEFSLIFSRYVAIL
jgi:hypothetical protein